MIAPIMPYSNFTLNPYAAGWFLTNTKRCKKTWKKTQPLANGYPSESAQRELSNEYQHNRVSDGFQKSLHPRALDCRSLSIGRVKGGLEKVYLPSYCLCFPSCVCHSIPQPRLPSSWRHDAARLDLGTPGWNGEHSERPWDKRHQKPGEKLNY